MRLLLDTQTLLWALDRPRQLRREAYEALESPVNDVHVSAITVWEIALKSGLLKLTLRADLLAEIERVGFAPLPLTWAHGLAAGALPLLHRDPFDRLLIAQARVEDLTIVTRDAVFADYGVPVMTA